MASIATIQDFKANLVRKATRGAVLVAPMSASIPVSFTTGAAADLVAFTGFESVGLISKDAPPTFTPETQSNAVEAWGVLEEVREDIIKRTLSVGFTPIQSSKKVLEMYHNVDLSAITADPVTKEVQFSEPTDPSTTYYRTIFLAVDGKPGEEIYFGRVLPRASIAEVAAQDWNPESAIAYPMTVKAKVDDVLGYSSRLFFGGPGWAQLVEEAGFTIGTP
ncbi:phage tail tube protein [Rhodococcus rhodochrous]|uniref:phage tail tube protein n=1 Tax=Rhodococcus rhodochrous TaxID=1829 RepID=UPI00177F2A0E|nr:hypothetical protein [Rhodococcus rhodochrous]QOH59888.1 hypothetical protein C6Y44_27750 [Rhodococcus rhodochrous]